MRHFDNSSTEVLNCKEYKMLDSFRPFLICHISTHGSLNGRRTPDYQNVIKEENLPIRTCIVSSTLYFVLAFLPPPFVQDRDVVLYNT